MKFKADKSYTFKSCIIYSVSKVEAVDHDAKQELILVEGYSDETDDARFEIRHDRFAAFVANLHSRVPELSEKLNVWLSDKESSELFMPDLSPDEPIRFDLTGIQFQFSGRKSIEDADLGDEVFHLFVEI